MNWSIETNCRIGKWLVIAVILVSSHMLGAQKIASSLSERQQKLLDQCEQLRYAGKPAISLAGLRVLRKQLGSTHRHSRVEAATAEVLIDLKRSREATVLVETYLRDRSKYQRVLAPAYLAGARAAFAQGRLREAIGLYDWIAAEENGGDMVIQLQAVKGVGQVMVNQGQLAEALEAFRFGLSNIAAARARRRKVSEAAELDVELLRLEAELKALVSSIRSVLADRRRRAEEEAFTRRVGAAFILYRDAEKLRRGDRNFKAARQKYIDLAQKFPATVYANAGKLYGAICLLETGGLVNARRAERELEVFVAEAPPIGLYRGEALLWMGRIAVEYRRDPARAARCFKQLDDWIIAVRKRIKAGDDEIDGYQGVKNGAAKLSVPPKQQFSQDLWGNMRATRVQFGQLLNRKTSKWYLDDLEARCATFRGFLYFAGAEGEKAKAQFERILKLDPRQTGGRLAWNPNNFTRLQFGAKYGRLIAFPQELKLYSKPQRFVILLADFYYVTERFDLALKLHRKLQSGYYGKLNRAQLDFVRYMQASCIYMMPVKNRSKAMLRAISLLNQVLEDRDNTWTEPRAAFKIYQISRFMAIKQVVDRGDKLLRQLAFAKQHTPYTNESRLLVALDWIEEDRFDEAIKLLSSIPARDAPYWHQAQSYIKALDDPDSALWTFIQKPHPSKRKKVKIDDAK
jgi:tetratricopeptide (TPR) repeat protein